MRRILLIGALLFVWSLPTFAQASDTNEDWVVTPADAVYVVNRIGQTIDSSNQTADINHDNAIDATDVELVLAWFDNIFIPPYANFEYYCPGATCVFYADLPASNPSRDDDGVIVEYRWDFDDFVTYTATDPFASHTYQADQDYDVTLTVEDNEGMLDSITRRITITGSGSINQDPIASFIVTSCEAYTCDFDASASYDTDGVIIAYDWDMDNDGVYEMNTGNNPSASYEFASYGTKTVSLRVRDNYSPSASDTYSYTFDLDAINISPYAAIVSYACNAARICTFEGGGGDPDGDSIQFQWDIDYDGATFTSDYTTMNINHQYLADGVYDVALRTYDGQAYSPFQVVTIVAGTNNPPVINSVTCVVTDPIVTCTADVTDEAPSLLIYSWDMGDGTLITTSNAIHTYSANGIYDIVLTVTDDAGQSDNTSASPETVIIGNPYTVTITPTDCANTTDFSCLLGFTLDPVETTIASCDWDFGFPGIDGVSTSCAPDVVFPASGSYTVILATTNTFAEVAYDTATVRVRGFYMQDVDALGSDNGTKWVADVTFTIVDDQGNAVSGLTVHGDFSEGMNNVSCVTNSSGFCIVSSGDIPDTKTSTTFIMDSLITGGMMPYDYSRNTDDDDDYNEAIADGLIAIAVDCPPVGSCDN